MVSRFKRLAKEGIWIVLGQIITFAGALLLVRVLTAYLSPAQYGQLALSLTAASLVNQVLLGGITAGIGRYYSIASEKQELRGYLCASRCLLIYGTAAVVVLGLILLASLYLLGYSQWMGLLVAVLVFSVLTGYNVSLNAIQNAARQRAIVAFHGGLDAWLKIGLAVGFMLLLGISTTAVVIGYACSSFITTVSQLFFLRGTMPRLHTNLPNLQQWVPQIWTFSLPFTTWGAFTWLQQVSDRWALQAFSTSRDVGEYAVLFQLGYTPIALITALATSFLAPILYQRSGDATDYSRNNRVHQIAWTITYLSIFVTLLGFVITFSLHEWLFDLLVANEYRDSSRLLPWVVLAGGLFATAQMLALKLMSEMKLSAMTIVKIVTALIGILLNIVGAALAGMQGVVWALVAFSVIYFSSMVVLALKPSTASKMRHSNA